MVIALGAPEFLFFLAINELIGATALVKRVQAYHPHLAKRPTIRGLFVSAQYLYVI